MEILSPFVKWVGGKRQIVEKLFENIPNDYNTYIEPFVGGGAFLLNLKPKKAIIADINKELITSYRTIKKVNSYQKVMEFLNLFEIGHNFDNSKENSYYKEIVHIDRNQNERLLFSKMSNELVSARFIYLNKACFNGLYRVNSKGFFNVPSNKKQIVKTHYKDNIIKIHQYLKNNNIKILNLDFKQSLKRAKANDFVYLDPPYDQTFNGYSKKGFGQELQKKLAKACYELDQKNVKFMLSNNDTKLIRDLYKDFNIKIIKAKRIINSNGKKRGLVNEVIITNYEK